MKDFLRLVTVVAIFALTFMIVNDVTGGSLHRSVTRTWPAQSRPIIPEPARLRPIPCSPWTSTGSSGSAM
jgi:hypothetical protein